MDVRHLPPHLLERAAEMPENAHASALDPWRAHQTVTIERAALQTEHKEAQNRSETHAEAGGALSPRRKGATKRRGVPSRLEEQFEREVLVEFRPDGWQLSDWQCEGVTLRIADVGAITPDWAAWDSLGRLYLFEVKGHKVHEASVLRTKAFAKAYPQVRFLIYCRRDKRWHLYFDSRA